MSTQDLWRKVNAVSVVSIGIRKDKSTLHCLLFTIHFIHRPKSLDCHTLFHMVRNDNPSRHHEQSVVALCLSSPVIPGRRPWDLVSFIYATPKASSGLHLEGRILSTTHASALFFLPKTTELLPPHLSH